MVGAFTPSASAIIEAATPEPKDFVIHMESSANLVLQRKSYVSINFAEIGLDLGKTYTVTLPPGFFLDGFDEPSAGNSFNFTTPATVPLVSSFTPASNAINHNTYADQYVYVDYDRAVILQNKNFYLYSNYGNPSGYIVSTINALSNRVSVINETKIRIDLSPDIMPARTYWIKADEGAVVDSFYFKSAEITGNTYNFTTVSASSVSVSSSASLSCSAMKVKAASASISSTSSITIDSIRLFRLIHTISYEDNGNNGVIQTKTFGNYTLVLRSPNILTLFNNTTGLKIRDTTFTIPTGLVYGKSIALNSNNYVVAITMGNNFDTSVVYGYSITTGQLTYTISGEIPQLGTDIEMNDNYLAISGTGEYNGVQAGVLICNPSTGGINRKIIRPNTPWRAANQNLGTFTYFGNRLSMNDNGYIAISETNDATSSSSYSRGNFRIYNMSNGLLQSRVDGGRVGFENFTAFWDLNMNNSIVMSSDSSTTNQYSTPGGNFIKIIKNPANSVYGLNDKWAILSTSSGRKLLELSSNVYQDTDILNDVDNVSMSNNFVSTSESSTSTVNGVTTTYYTTKIYRF